MGDEHRLINLFIKGLIMQYKLILFLLLINCAFNATAMAQHRHNPFMDHKTQLKKAKHKEPTKQIMIAARIVTLNRNSMRKLGLQFNTSTSNANDNSDGFNQDLVVQNSAAGNFGFVIAKLSAGRLLDAQLAALQSEGCAEVIARPRLMTLDRKSAYIESGEDIPYQEKTGQGNTSVAFKKAALRLKVRPVIVGKNRLVLHLTLNQDQVSALRVAKMPAITTQKIKTQIRVINRHTVVLGGIFEQQNSTKQLRLPFLSSLPLLGPLFRYKEQLHQRKELLIFISPQIV